MRTFLLASGNAGKLREFREIFEGDTVLSLKDFPPAPEVVEDGTTFEENSAKKALETAKRTGVATVADDSGLCVEALGGAPGIFSARYAGEGATDAQRIEKLLRELDGCSDRRAKFVSAVTYATPDGQTLTVRGECAGVILTAPRGENGFGYDPVFYVEEYGRSFAELTAEEKNAISHRGRAIRALREKLISEKN